MKKRPELSYENLRILESKFDKDLAELGGWLGTDISCNNFKGITTARTLNWNH